MATSHRRNTVQKVSDIDLEGLSPRIQQGIKNQMKSSMTRLPFIPNIDAMNKTTMDLDIELDDVGSGEYQRNRNSSNGFQNVGIKDKLRRFGSVQNSGSDHLIERTGVEVKKDFLPFTMNF